METEKNFKEEKNLKFTQFFTSQAFEAGDFLNIFLGFLDFWLIFL